MSHSSLARLLHLSLAVLQAVGACLRFPTQLLDHHQSLPMDYPMQVLHTTSALPSTYA